MKYKQALERARDLMTNQNPPAFDKDLISLVFPELQESEDERIRKALKQGFSQYGNSFTTFGGIKVEDIIAWLEKQGDCVTCSKHH